MKTQKQNPNGLHLRYRIQKIDGTPVDKKGEYFVLKLNSSDEPHRLACLAAVNAYADIIKEWEPKLAKDIKSRFPHTPKSISLAKSDGSFYGRKRT